MAYPSNHNAVFSAAGGGTDLVNRTLASIMERELNTKITVVNMPGASGGVAANYVYSRPRDGYNWLGCSEGILPVAVLERIRQLQGLGVLYCRRNPGFCPSGDSLETRGRH